MSKPLSLFQQMQIQRDEAIQRAEKAEAELDGEKDHCEWADGHIEWLHAELDKAETEVERLHNELRIIANAKWRDFKSVGDFRVWAQSRARHALGEKPGELTVKKS